MKRRTRFEEAKRALAVAPFNPGRLIEALQGRGMTAREIVERVGRTEWKVATVEERAAAHRPDVAAIAAGQIAPTVADLVWLAQLLHFPPAFFTKPVSKAEPGPIFFCRTRSAERLECAFCTPRFDGTRWRRKAAVALCDHVADPLKLGTCDKPMCGEHRHRIDDETDACPDHAATAPGG